jgi:tRNA A-37 threonylcarbamoyl transferase component Bud32
MKDDNRYDILQEVGRGAMGIVYKATDRETSECVALKVLKPEVVEDQSMMHRFKREMLIARKITHRNVCRIYDFTQVSRGPCITMEFVEGETLRALLNRSGALKLQSAIDITRQICSGLREAHAQGVAHRDLKPENLMIDRNGNVKIMDFGVARLFANNAATTLGMLVGTPAYMPPEQVEGRETDQRSDIYAFGLILYEMLTGSVVFKADTPLAVAYKQVHDPVPPPRSVDPSIPDTVQTLILRCLEKDPDRRFQTIDQLESAFTEMGYRPPSASDPPAVVPARQNTTFIMARRKARRLMMAVQVLYFSIYSAALYHAEAAGRELEQGFQIPGTVGVYIVIVLAMLGIATRLYLLSALVWDHPDLPKKFRRLFPALWLLDTIWAASPVLLLDWMRLGVILGCVAVLAYVPFSQKTLMENMPQENPIRKF